jgi:hypothetical protein
MKQNARRLAALESRLAAQQPRQDQVTLSEWLAWNETGIQPERWRKSATLQAHVATMHERRAQADAALALLDDGDA